MARTKDDVQKAAAAADDTTSKRRGRPAKDITSAATDAGVKKPAGKRGRPAGTTPTTKPKPAAAADGTTKRRGRPPGSANKATGEKKTTTKRKPSTSAAAKKLRDFLPAIPAEESTTGADRRRAKLAGNKLEELPQVKKTVNPNDGRRKNKGVAKTPKGVTPRKSAVSPVKRSSPAVGGLRSSPNGLDDASANAGKENASQTPLFGGFKSMFG